MSNRFHTDVLVIGSGAAGLALALHLHKKHKVIVLSKDDVSDGSTNRAQGGVAAVTDPADSIDNHIRDTIVAGDGLCDGDVVRNTIRQAPEAIRNLNVLGLQFDREDNALHLTREGGHSHRRVLHVADATGKAISSTLISRATESPNISLITNRVAIDVISAVKSSGQREISGAYVYNRKLDVVEVIEAQFVILATGGASKVYQYTSNPDGSTGDGIAMAWRAGCRITNMEFNQFHPTCLYHPNARSFLISEAVRGEGGRLVLPNGTPFMHRFDERQELAPRDIVARAIDFEMKRLGAPCVYLDTSHLDRGVIEKRFPTILEKCLELNIDMRIEPLPVVPAAHYTCGGIHTNSNGETDVPGLYAVGEASSTGLHGANRLASNSLLECLVFAQSAANHINQVPIHVSNTNIPDWDETQVTDSDENVVLSHNWAELRRFMWDYVGIVRTNKRLARAAHRIDLLKREVHEYYSNHRVNADLIELRNLIHVADLIVRSAQHRTESRGLHYTLDYPKKQTIAKPTILYPTVDPLDVLRNQEPHRNKFN